MRRCKKNTRIDPTTGERRPLTAEERSVRGKIRKGVYPPYHFKRQEYGKDPLESYVNKRGRTKLTYRLQSTFRVLTTPVLKAPEKGQS